MYIQRERPRTQTVGNLSKRLATPHLPLLGLAVSGSDRATSLYGFPLAHVKARQGIHRFLAHGHRDPARRFSPCGLPSGPGRPSPAAPARPSALVASSRRSISSAMAWLSRITWRSFRRLSSISCRSCSYRPPTSPPARAGVTGIPAPPSPAWAGTAGAPASPPPAWAGAPAIPAPAPPAWVDAAVIAAPPPPATAPSPSPGDEPAVPAAAPALGTAPAAALPPPPPSGRWTPAQDPVAVGGVGCAATGVARAAANPGGTGAEPAPAPSNKRGGRRSPRRLPVPPGRI